MTETIPPQATEELGSTISPYQRWQGIDPKTGDWYDFGSELAARDVEDMLGADGRARSVELALTLPLRAAPLAITPGKGDTGQCERVNESLDQMDTPVPLVVGHAAQSLIFRAAFLEKVFTVERGRVDYSTLAWRPPDACAITRDRGTGKVTGFRQQVFPIGGKTYGDGWVRIPAAKAAIFLHGANRDPVRGVSEMAVSYRCYRDKQRLRALWMILLERAAAPWVIATVAQGDKGTTASTLAKLRSGGVAAVSGVDSIDVLNVAGDAANLFENALKYLDSEMAGSILAGFLDLTGMASRGAGSLALSKDQTDFFTSSMDAAAREIATTFRTDIVTPLVRFNEGPDAVIPNVTLGPISGATTDQIVAHLQALAAAPSGTILPREYVDELTLKAAGVLDLDTAKIADDMKAAEARAVATATSPAAVEAAPLHAAADVLAPVARAAVARESA